jgi:hypothetical protein
LPLPALRQNSGRQKPGIAPGGIPSKLRQANDLALPLVALLQNSGRQKTRHCPWQHYFKTPAGKRLGIAPGGITSKLRQARDSALLLVALLPNSGRQKTRHCCCQHYFKTLAGLAALLHKSGRQKTRHCHCRHYFKTLAGKRLGIASLEMLLWLLKLHQANDLALPLVALLQNSGRQKTRHCRWWHYFKTLAGKRLGIAAGGITSKLQQAKD